MIMLSQESTSGWLCPRCGTSNSPASRTCNGCAPGQTTTMPPIVVPFPEPCPTIPLYPWQSPITCESGKVVAQPFTTTQPVTITCESGTVIATAEGWQATFNCSAADPNTCLDTAAVKL